MQPPAKQKRVRQGSPSPDSLFDAVRDGDEARIEATLCNGASVDIELPNNYGATLALIAAEFGHVETVRMLAGLGANVETPMNNGATPAYVAAQNGHVEVVRVLAELGANVETPNNNDATPVYIAAQEGH